MLGTEPFDQCCPPTNSGARHASSTVTIRRVRALQAVDSQMLVATHSANPLTDR
jgi:hypothetical protein